MKMISGMNLGVINHDDDWHADTMQIADHEDVPVTHHRNDRDIRRFGAKPLENGPERPSNEEAAANEFVRVPIGVKRKIDGCPTGRILHQFDTLGEREQRLVAAILRQCACHLESVARARTKAAPLPDQNFHWHSKSMCAITPLTAGRVPSAQESFREIKVQALTGREMRLTLASGSSTMSSERMVRSRDAISLYP